MMTIEHRDYFLGKLQEMFNEWAEENTNTPNVASKQIAAFEDKHMKNITGQLPVRQELFRIFIRELADAISIIKTTTVDDELSETSENPVQNKVIAKEFNSFRAAKADKVRVVNQTESTVTIQPNVMNVWGTITNLNVSKGDDIADIVNNYMIRFTAGDSAAVIFNGMNVKWYGGEVPTWTAGNTYEISIVDNIALWVEIEA